MAPPGGPAALYGFLYQVLRTAEWALEIDLRAPERNVADVTLVAEPRHADLEIRWSQKRIVAQFKVRDDRPWSLADLIETVLPNLYAATGDGSLESRYEFVTSGHIGQWTSTYEFFTSLAYRTVGMEPLDALDATKKRFLLKGTRHSERSLFEEIVRVLRGSAATEDPATTRKKAWYLLSHFELRSTGDATEAKERVRQLLSTYVLDDAVLEDKVSRLLDVTQSYVVKGDRKFRPDELLREAGIEGIAFTKLPLLREAARAATLQDLGRLTGYDRSLSVRAVREWPESGRIVVFAGESGQGKSWCLGDLAHELMEDERTGIVVFVRATGKLHDDLNAAALRIVRDVLGKNMSATFEQLAKKIKDSVPGLCDPWLTVCLDDVHASAEITALCDEPLERWGIRVALTTLPRHARHAQLARRRAAVEYVSDFSEDELRMFLVRNERDWAAIPPDVRTTMRRPLLAHMFVNEAPHWTPKREYQLYEAWWRRLSTEREQPDHPDDVRLVLALARDFLQGGPYPWSPAKLEERRMTGEQQVRLEAVGWLRAERDGVRMWHDRLLNWAVAEAIASELGQLGGPDAIAERLQAFWREPGTVKGERPRLGYVPMDVFWMATTRDLLSTEQVALVIQHLEPVGFSERSFYEMFASLGPAIVPALVARWRVAEAEEDSHGVAMNIREAITSALRGEKEAGEAHVLAFLRDPFTQLRELGIRLARNHPAASYAPILWPLLVEHDTQPDEEAGYDWRREHLVNALAASARKARAWLAQEIRALASSTRHAVTLAWLLSELHDADGRAMWLALKEQLFASTPADKPGGLIECILNFRDMDEVEKLERWLTAKFDFAAPSSLGALAILQPDKALQFVKTGGAAIVGTFASWWLPWLLLVRRSATLQAARERLIQDDRVPEWFHFYANEVDAVTAKAMTDKLAVQLEEFLGKPLDRRVGFESTSRLLADAAQADVVDVLRAHRGTKFEQQLIASAERLPPEISTFHYDAASHVRVILRRVGDEAAAKAVAIALLSGSKLPDAEIDWAVAYPSVEVRDALRTFTRRHVEPDQQWIPHSVMRSVRALALIGDDEGVIEAIWLFGANVVQDDVPWLIESREPISEVLLDRLRQALTSDNETERARALGGLRVSRRPDLVYLALDHALDAEPASAVRYQGLRAARDLIMSGVEIAGRMQNLVAGPCDDERFVIAELLFRSGTPAALDLAAALARKLPFNHLRDLAIVAQLVDGTARGKEMAQLLQSKLFPFPYSSIVAPDDTSYWELLLPVLDDPSLRQKALDAALVESAAIDSIALIECVATFDRASAFDLAHAALKTDRQGREVIPPYLAKYDARRAVHVFLEHLPDEPVGAVRWSIARVLRWSDEPSVASYILEMTSDGSPFVREAGYDCAGWRMDVIHDDDLRHAALNDEHPAVRMAARDAIRRRCRLRQVQILRERLAASSGSTAWCYAEALTAYGDPHLLARRNDELCVWPVVQDKPRVLSVQIETWIEERRDEVLKEAGSEDDVRRRFR